MKGIYASNPRKAQCYLSLGWELKTIARDQVEIAIATSSVQFPFFLYWYHFPFHLSNLHWNISINFKAKFPIPWYYGFGMTLTSSNVEVRLSEVSSPAPIVITSCRKNKKNHRNPFCLYCIFGCFQPFLPRKKFGCPNWDKILTLAADFIGWLRLLHQSKFAPSCVPLPKSSFQLVRSFKIVWIFFVFINPIFTDAIFKQICDKIFPQNL